MILDLRWASFETLMESLAGDVRLYVPSIPQGGTGPAAWTSVLSHPVERLQPHHELPEAPVSPRL
jgi:hypothetical protein